MKSTENRFSLLIVVLYAVGTIGYIIPSLHKWILPLTPFQLILTYGLTFLFHKKWGFTSAFTLLSVEVMGFFIEYAGVKTGIIFGEYEYGKTLGPDYSGIPFLIGLNWAGLVLCSSSVLFTIVKSNWVRILGAAILMVILDFAMEPVAVVYDFWHWSTAEIPMQNYVAWFITALFFQWIWHQFGNPSKNKIAATLFWVQLAFFGIIHVYLRFR
jgi:bisanhydrobacterioruberin hydratase